MTEEQKKGWAYAIEHAPKGLLRQLDASLLAVWVVAEDLHRQATLQVKRYGMVVKSSNRPDAVPVQSPYLPIINRQAELMLRAASELGFTPTSRSRITLAGASTKKNKFQNNAAKRA